MAYLMRSATLDDVPILCRHRRRMFEDMGHTNAKVLDSMSKQFAEWVKVRLQNQTYLAWLAVDDANEVVAGAGLWLIDWPPHVLGSGNRRGYILNIYTEVEFRRQGLARQLTELCIDACRQRRISIIALHASEYGRSLYETLGFTTSNEMRLALT